MIFLADESVDFGIISELRKLNFEVIAISETNPGIPDVSVIEIANLHSYIIIIEDKDFGELTYRLKIKNKGIFLIRLYDLSRNDRIEIAVKIIATHIEQLKDRFSVLTSNGLRIKKYS